MMLLKRFIAILIAALILVSCGIGIAAASTSAVRGLEQTESEDASCLGDLKTQLEGLYRRVGQELNIDYLYVKILHMIAGGKAAYADTVPDIYLDQTLLSASGAFDIAGADQDYDRMAPWAECADNSVCRPSGYYLPDAAYNVTADIVAIMNNRFVGDRGSMQGYFDVLETDVKRKVLFCEAVLQYMEGKETADCFFISYLQILDAKAAGENVLIQINSGVEFKETFKQILMKNGIESDAVLRALSIILSFDGNLAAGSSVDSVTTESVIPYEIGYTSRENMMIAAMSLVGKCRYVWGGGHLGSSRIEGINPMWRIFSDAYGTSEGEEGYTECIVPDGSWCPIHGAENDWDGCLYSEYTVYSLEDYLGSREECLDLSAIDIEELSELLEPVVDFSEGVTPHRLDGLDCSGYTSWLYNQVSSDRNVYDAGALYFMSQYGISRLSSGTRLLPGDLFSWGDHIVVIVAPVSEGSKAYVMLESGPSNVKFGVTYYSGASQADINAALEVAMEANLLLGNMDDGEDTRKFSMSLRYSGSSSSDSWRGYRAWGRLRQPFEDQDTILPEYGKNITELTAQEVIQHTMEQMPYQYISGAESYDGNLFDLEAIISSMTEIETSELDWTDIVLNSELN